MVEVKNKDSGTTWQIATDATLHELKDNHTVFFRNKSGTNETYEIYKGQIIVSYTFSCFGRKARKHSVYVHIAGSSDEDHRMPDLFCISSPHNVREAKEVIDQLLETKSYAYKDYPH